jgi:hypothetical protein
MTDGDRIVVIGSGDASSDDVEALRAIQDYRRDELPRLQARAERWIGGLTALTGVLTAAVVVKGPDTFSKLTPERELLGMTFSPKDVIVGALLFGGVAIALGTWWAYSAANGDPLSRSGLEELVRKPPSSAAGAAAKWQTAVAVTAASARIRLRRGSAATIVGVFLLAVAVVVTWTTTEASSTPDSVCVIGSNGAVVRLEGELPKVATGEVTVVPCQ